MMQGPEFNSEGSKQSGHGWMQSLMPNQINREPNPSLSLRTPNPKRTAWGAVILRGALAVLFVLVSTGCVTKGDFLRLQERVAENHRTSANEPDPFARIAQLSSDVESLRQEVRDLQGELELARKEAADALMEVRRTRTVLAGAGAAVESAGAGATAGDESEQGAAALGASRTDSETSPGQELAGYQQALDAWRGDDFPGCIDLFTAFLQKHPTSGYSDDAAYWLADCTYKNDEFKRAVVRFNAVVSVYPDSPKAPDALYRQGESLLKLGPKFHEAARTVFKKVQKDYPESERAGEAARQLERLGAG
jgi:tol-pal system protein YbgF